MDTKSKSLNKAAEWSVLGILCVVFTVVCTYTRIFWVYQRAGWYWGKRGILFFTVSFWVGLGFSAVLVILFLWRLYQMYKKNIFREIGTQDRSEAGKWTGSIQNCCFFFLDSVDITVWTLGSFGGMTSIFGTNIFWKAFIRFWDFLWSFCLRR